MDGPRDLLYGVKSTREGKRNISLTGRIYAIKMNQLINKQFYRLRKLTD